MPEGAMVAGVARAVCGPSRSEFVGWANTLDKALAMVVDRLPPICGPAFVGTPEELAEYEKKQQKGRPEGDGRESEQRKAMADSAKAWERQPGESAAAWEAFACYGDLGLSRSISKVADALHKARTLIERWSTTHQWVYSTSRGHGTSDHQTL